MGMLEATPLGAPGNLGLNTQDSPINLAPQFATEALNGVIDEEGRLACRKGFIALGDASSYLGGTPVKNCFQHYLKDGTNDTIYCGNGYILYNKDTPTLIMDYAQGSQVVDVGGAKTGASATGLLNDATVYTASINVDGGGGQAIAVTGSAAQTYTTLLAEINADLTGATAYLYQGNIKVRSDTTGATSTIAITDTNLFSTLTSYVAINSAAAGQTGNNNWQFASLNGYLFGAQSFYDLHGWDESESDYGDPQSLAHSTFTNPNTIMAAYGRLWAADVSGNDYTVYFSVLQDGTDFNGAGSGSLDLTTVFVDGKDSIVALGAHNNRLIIFCQKAVYIYKLPTDLDPAGMTLEDVIVGAGCIARDTVVTAGDDILWLSPVGVQSLKRRVVYDTLPLTDISHYVHQNIINRVVTVADLNEVRGFYYAQGGWYLLTCPQTNTVWVFNMVLKTRGENSQGTDVGSPRVTQWVDESKILGCFTSNPQGQLLCGSTNGMYIYSGYGSTSNKYTFRFTTGWLGLNNPAALKHFKKILVTLRGGSGQTGVVSWSRDFKDTYRYVTFEMGTENAAYEYGVHEYNDLDDVGVLYGGVGPGTVTNPDDFVLSAFYTEGQLVEDKYVQIGSSAKFIRIRVELEIEGDIVSLYNMTVFDTRGKLR